MAVNQKQLQPASLFDGLPGLVGGSLIGNVSVLLASGSRSVPWGVVLGTIALWHGLIE
jgi:hypothetical protein